MYIYFNRSEYNTAINSFDLMAFQFGF